MKIKELLKSIESNILNRDNVPEIPTGLTDLDNLIWGFKRKETIVIAGRPSQGKSSLSLFLAYKMAQLGRFKVAVFSLEMGKEEIAERFLAMATHTNNEHIMKGALSEEGKQVIHEYITDVADIELYIHDDIGFKWQDVEKYIVEEKPDILFVDFIQMITANQGQTEREAYSEYIRKAKIFVKQYNCCIVLNSQINRNPDIHAKIPDIPKMSELKGSGALEEGSDKVIICHWYWKYHAKKEDGSEYSKYDYALYVAKNRNGRTGLVQVIFVPENYNFKDGIKGLE